MNNNASDTLIRTGSYERPSSPDQGAAALNRGEIIRFGDTMALQRADGDRLRVSFGHRMYVVDADVFERLVDTAVSEHWHTMNDRPHERWCDQERHARADAEALEGHPECIGHDHPLTLSGQEYGGYWRQMPDSGETRLCADWPGLHFTEMSVEQVRAAYRVALAFGASRDVDQVTTMLGDALDEYEGGDAWRDAM